MAARTILSLAAAATCVAANAPIINPLISSSQSTNNNNRLGITPRTTRQLQEADGSSYAYLDDLTGYSLQYATCVRAKIPQENDDDEVDGNVNFYNGRYHAQYQIYATFHVCGDGSGSANQCSASCDYNVEYTTPVNQFLETSLNFWEGYCGTCANACRRKLDEDNNGGDYDVDCNTCSSECKTYYKAGDDNDDETNYIDCAAAYEENGMQLYYGPQCSDDGEIVIGVFYDDECTIKTKNDGPNFDYYKFDTIYYGCIDCSDNQGAETCADLYGDSYHCVNGNDKTGQDNEMNACAVVKKALMNVDYSGVKKRHSGADQFIKMFFTLLFLGIAGGSVFLSYTYYLRHSGDKTGSLLTSEDVHVPEAPGAAMTQVLQESILYPPSPWRAVCMYVLKFWWWS